MEDLMIENEIASRMIQFGYSPEPELTDVERQELYSN